MKMRTYILNETQEAADDLVSKRDYVQTQSLNEIKTALEKRNIFAVRLDFVNLDFHDDY